MKFHLTEAHLEVERKQRPPTWRDIDWLIDMHQTEMHSVDVQTQNPTFLPGVPELLISIYYQSTGSGCNRLERLTGYGLGIPD